MDSFYKEIGVIAGSDESLKGDTFGGIVVAAVKADDSGRKKLFALGVKDSKKLTEIKIKYIADKIKTIVHYKVISVLPEQYNKYDGVTLLLNELHAEALSSLGEADLRVVDKYPGCNLNVKMETKGESKYIEIAAASILARAEALKQMERLNIVAGFRLPLGSSHVEEALKKAVSKGINLRKVAKLHFSNVKKYI